MSDQVYLKCVSGSVSGTRVGDIRKAWWSEDDLMWYMEDPEEPGIPWTFDMDKKEIEGCECYFEEISDPTQEQTTVTPKLTPRSLGCFQEVADVIGEDAAEIELQRVIDYPKDLVGEDDQQSLIGCFIWSDTPQGNRFWLDISNGDVPEGCQTNCHQKSTIGDNSSEKSEPKSAPEFGDVLHIHNTPYVFIKEPENDVEWCVVNSKGTMMWFHKKSFDEYHQYAPDKTQELREQILKDWQQQGLEWAHDTEVCRVDMSVGDIISFILENGYRKYEA